ncbi:hypothetical protein L7F22_024333 [Adiantum nelumboides]|nr:hypothetical protein [Adiantum nelumboides]
MHTCVKLFDVYFASLSLPLRLLSSHVDDLFPVEFRPLFCVELMLFEVLCLLSSITSIHSWPRQLPRGLPFDHATVEGNSVGDCTLQHSSVKGKEILQGWGLKSRACKTSCCSSSFVVLLPSSLIRVLLLVGKGNLVGVGVYHSYLKNQN